MDRSFRDTPLWDNALPLEERLDFLMGELTLEEKIACMGTGNPEISRLGVPEFHVGGEAAHGVQARHDQAFDLGTPDFTTIFPNPIGMSSTWDEALLRQAGEVVGTEARGLFSRKHKGNLSVWAPTVDMERDPRWGRTEEAYGEDPLLTGRMAGAYVEGLQGEDAFYLRTAATLKHFYANNVEEGRTWKSSSIDDRNKWEYYLEPFRQVIVEHGAEAVMTAYNEINGVPAILNPEVQQILKDKWGLHHVVCDGGDASQTVEKHHYYDNHGDTIAAGLAAGIDCFTDDADLVTEAVKRALDEGKITEETLDRALRCHFGTLIRLGFFDSVGDNPYGNITMEQVGTGEHHEIARKVSAEGIVLLQNRPVPDGKKVQPDGISKEKNGRQDGKKILPLDMSKNIAVIGPLADKWYKDWYTGLPPYQVTPLQGLQAVYDGGEIETGITHVRIRLGDNMYLGVDEQLTVYRCSEGQAEVFEMECWDGEQITLRSMKNGMLLTVDDNADKGQKKYVTATKEEAYGWFVREVFHVRNCKTGGDAVSTDKGICEAVLFRAWNGAGIQIDEQDRLFVLDKEQDEADENRKVEVDGLPIYFEMVKDGIAMAKKTAAKADTVVLFLGANPIITCKEEVDRKNLFLSPYQEKLMKEVYEVNSNIVLVLVSSVPFGIDWAKEHIPAVLVTATGGMELGNALADVLVGKVSPAGRLPMTWYSAEEKLPAMDDYDIIRSERTYQYYQGKPLYPFGHGVTYGDIRYEKMRVEVCREGSTQIVVTVSLRNKGAYSTDDVVQIYGRKIDSALKRPQRQLLDFKRVKDIRPGECREVTLCIPVERLRYYEVIQEKMLLEDGQYEIMAGASSEELPLRETIFLHGEVRGCRKTGKAFRAAAFDWVENGILVENDGWLPDGVTLVEPKEGKGLRLVYECVEIPDDRNVSLEVSFREKGEWSLSLQLGSTLCGTAKSVCDVGDLSRNQSEDGSGKISCRHYRGMQTKMKKIVVALEPFAGNTDSSEDSENRESIEEGNMGKLVVEAGGAISLSELRVVAK